MHHAVSIMYVRVLVLAYWYFVFSEHIAGPDSRLLPTGKRLSCHEVLPRRTDTAMPLQQTTYRHRTKHRILHVFVLCSVLPKMCCSFHTYASNKVEAAVRPVRDGFVYCGLTRVRRRFSRRLLLRVFASSYWKSGVVSHYMELPIIIIYPLDLDVQYEF